LLSKDLTKRPKRQSKNTIEIIRVFEEPNAEEDKRELQELAAFLVDWTRKQLAEERKTDKTQDLSLSSQS